MPIAPRDASVLTVLGLAPRHHIRGHVTQAGRAIQFARVRAFQWGTYDSGSDTGLAIEGTLFAGPAGTDEIPNAGGIFYFITNAQGEWEGWAEFDQTMDLVADDNSGTALDVITEQAVEPFTKLLEAIEVYAAPESFRYTRVHERPIEWFFDSETGDDSYTDSVIGRHDYPAQSLSRLLDLVPTGSNLYGGTIRHRGAERGAGSGEAPAFVEAVTTTLKIPDLWHVIGQAGSPDTDERSSSMLLGDLDDEAIVTLGDQAILEGFAVRNESSTGDGVLFSGGRQSKAIRVFADTCGRDGFVAMSAGLDCGVIQDCWAQGCGGWSVRLTKSANHPNLFSIIRSGLHTDGLGGIIAEQQDSQKGAATLYLEMLRMHGHGQRLRIRGWHNVIGRGFYMEEGAGTLQVDKPLIHIGPGTEGSGEQHWAYSVDLRGIDIHGTNIAGWTSGVPQFLEVDGGYDVDVELSARAAQGLTTNNRAVRIRSGKRVRVKFGNVSSSGNRLGDRITDPTLLFLDDTGNAEFIYEDGT